MVPLCLPFCNIFLKCNLLPEFMEHFSMHLICLKMFPWNFFVKYTVLFVRNLEGSGHLWEQNVLFREEGSALSLCYRSCCPRRARQRLPVLISAPRSFVRSWGSPVANTRGEGAWRKEKPTFCIQRLAEALRSGLCFMCAWPRVTQTPLAELSADSPRGDTCDVYYYLLVTSGSLHFQSLTVTLKI